MLAIDFMHSKYIVHRDLKLANILLNSNEEGVLDIRIADFGLAKKLKPGQFISEKCGTPTYIAPEVLRGDPYSFKADIFSLGSIMYNLLTGRYLFDEEDHNLLLKQNLKCDLTPIKKYIEAVSPQAADLMMSLL